MRTELLKEELLIKHNNEIFEIETLNVDKQNQDYIELEINSIK